MSSKAVFLDRDGVIIRNREDYVKSVDEVEMLDGAAEGVGLLSELGFKVVIVTNQSMVNRRLSTIENLNKVHQRIREILTKAGGKVDAIYYCPHTPEEKCNCRKPNIGLFLKAVQELDIDVSRSWLVGDRATDAEAGRNLGCKVIEVQTNAKHGLLKAAVQIAKREWTESLDSASRSGQRQRAQTGFPR